MAGFGCRPIKDAKPTIHRCHREPPYVLVGSSAGALIATEIARQYPQWVSALVITGFGLIVDVESWWQDLMALSSDATAFLEAAYYRPPKQTSTLQRAVAEVLSCPAYDSFLDGGGFCAMRKAFENIHVPTLFVAGEHDGIIPLSAVVAAAACIPGAQLEWLARCGHFPPAEQPEELLYVIRRFLSKRQL